MLALAVAKSRLEKTGKNIMQFQILNLNTDQFLTDDSGSLLTFVDGSLAFAKAADETTKTGIRHQPRRIATDDSAWIMREQARFDSGHYTSPHWLDGSNEAGSVFNLPANLFVHVSKLEPSKIALTPSPEHGIADRQVIMRVGSFLERYAIWREDIQPITKQSIIENRVLQHTTYYAPVAIQYASTADDIERVYVAGPRSCMSQPADYYSSYVHPVRVYGGSDLSLAYLTDLDDSERITARALVWKDKNRHGRIYGDEHRMQRALEIAGYSQGDFLGARIRNIIDDRKKDTYVMPYLDHEQQVSKLDSDWLMIDCDGSIHATQTNGLAVQGVECESCGEMEDAGSLREVYTREDRVRQWCSHCADDNAFHCEQTGSLVANEHMAIIDGESVADWHVESANYCEYHEEHTFEPCFDVIVSESGETQSWSRGAFQCHGDICRIDGLRYSDSLLINDAGVSGYRFVGNELPDDATNTKELESA